MSRPLTVTWILFGLIVAVASVAALYTGINETRLDLAARGGRQALTAEELVGTRGWMAAMGCVRHDLAVAVTPSGAAFRLGARPLEAEDRILTPLAARGDCDEERRPARLYALVEEDLSQPNTIGYAYDARIAPPPVAALVDGVVGYGVGNGAGAAAARAQLTALGAPLADGAPLLVKGRRPGVLWVAAMTAAAGVHGLALLALMAWWMRRRMRARDEHGDGAEDDGQT